MTDEEKIRRAIEDAIAGRPAEPQPGCLAAMLIAAIMFAGWFSIEEGDPSAIIITVIALGPILATVLYYAWND